MSADVDIKISARNQAKSELDQLRKDFRDLQKAQREATDPAQARAFEKALSAVDARIKDAQSSLRKANIELDKAEAKSKGLGRVWQGAGKFITENAEKIRLAGVAAAASLTLFAKGALSKFSSVEDASSALEATFSNVGASMIDWAKRSGDALNLSQEEALNALQRFAGVGMAAQMHGQQLAGFAQSLVERAAQMASYYGGTTQDALDAISAGLRGEADPLERYNVFLNDAALKAELLQITGEKVNGTLTAQQRILAANSVIMRQSSMAAGDIARTQDSTANALKDASQQWSDLQASMGETVAQGAGPLLRVVSKLMSAAGALPGPVKAVGLGIAAVGAAAMIATPRIIAMNNALASRGGLLGVAKGGWKAAAAITAVTAAVTAAQSAAAQGSDYYFDDVGTALRNIVQPGWYGTLNNVGGALRKAILPFWSTDLEDSTAAVANLDLALTDLVNQGRADEAKRQFDDLVEGAQAWGGTVDDVRAQLPGYASALDSVADASGEVAREQNAAAAAADRMAAAQKGLSRAMGAAERMLARRDAKRNYRDALAAYEKDPTQVNADAVSASILAVQRTFKNPEGVQASRWAKRSIEEFGTAVDNAMKGKSDAIRSAMTEPLQGVYAEALKVLDVFHQMEAVNLAGVSLVNKRTAELGFAEGGPVWGPGSGTSDSIPARLSRGEFVIRAAAAKAIGYEKLTVLNRADRIPAALTPIGRSSDPVIVQPHLTANVTATGQIDYEQALRREARRVMRDARTRGVKVGR